MAGGRDAIRVTTKLPDRPAGPLTELAKQFGFHVEELQSDLILTRNEDDAVFAEYLDADYAERDELTVWYEVNVGRLLGYPEDALEFWAEQRDGLTPAAFYPEETMARLIAEDRLESAEARLTWLNSYVSPGMEPAIRNAV